MMDQSSAFRIIQRLTFRQQTVAGQRVFQIIVAIVVECRLTLLFVQRVVRLGHTGDDRIDLAIHLAAILCRAGNDQRGSRLVDQNTVDLVHDREVMRPLIHLTQFRLHVVAQVIEPQLVVGRIGNVALIGGFLLVLGLLRNNNAGRQTQCGIDFAHPVGVAAGQVIVDRDDMHTLAGQRIQIGRKGRDKGLALACLHLGNVTLMQENPAHQLRVKGPQTQGTARGLAAIGKGFRQQRIKALAAHRPFRHRLCAGLNLLVAQRGELRLQRVDLVDQRAYRLDLAIICGPKDLFRDRSQTQHILSARTCAASVIPI